ncbi:hypothetical protein SAMN05660909_02509 [Chitinophaga terrae (ex Kim and Jung 2007)]|uniref:Uncharacterized protein n=1 Tax=Chitinophaga terrae (ex Kim and Jung 2007) TaxID=408074 RepID=A0A1H4CAX7_9BACT|nr:hypothetical protein SAMN05660909_02509 [Chitinophaga terrae (ex Kim and Jung 2007)]
MLSCKTREIYYDHKNNLAEGMQRPWNTTKMCNFARFLLNFLIFYVDRITGYYV